MFTNSSDINATYFPVSDFITTVACMHEKDVGSKTSHAYVRFNIIELTQTLASLLQYQRMPLRINKSRKVFIPFGINHNIINMGPCHGKNFKDTHFGALDLL